MRSKAFNPQAFLELLCCILFGVLILYLVLSGKYLSYVTPKMKPYLYFTAGAMALFGISMLMRVARPQHRTRGAHCFVLVIPLLFLVLPHETLNSSNLAAGYTGGSAFSAKAPKKTQESTGSTPLLPQTETSYQLSGLDSENKTIDISNEDFAFWLSELYTNTALYEGYRVKITGFVYKDPETLKAAEFVPARLMMTCCVADLAPVGLVCRYDKAQELKADSWVTVEGRLFIGKYSEGGVDYDDPQIEVLKITPAQEVQEYIYP